MVRHGVTYPGDPDLLRREIRNHLVGPFAVCALVKGNIPEPEVDVSIFIKFRPIYNHTGRQCRILVNLGITCTGKALSSS